MAEPEVLVSPSADGEDVTMDGREVLEVDETGATDAPDVEEEMAKDEKPAESRITFLDYLKSPIISLHVGTNDSKTTLSAHQALLVRSPFFESSLDSSEASPIISLPDEDIDAVSAVLEYLYTGEYFPPKLPSGSGLVSHPSVSPMDTTGSQLLHHAKVYTLAEKLVLPALKTLSHSKIHLISSTASAELVYARYVYQCTSREDLTIRKPVASFWGQRSHVLRHETEGDFRKMCLEFPEFAFDVLSFVLDVEEKRERRQTVGHEGTPGGEGKARKRARGDR